MALALAWPGLDPVVANKPASSPRAGTPAAASPRAVTPAAPTPPAGFGPSGKGVAPKGGRGGASHVPSASPAALVPALPPVPDMLGFTLAELQPGDATAREAAAAKAEKRSRKAAWRAFASSGRLPSAALCKRMFRKGVPHAMRPAAWSAACGSEVARRNARASETYSGLLGRTATGEDRRAEQQIDLDVPRTFPQHPWLGTPEARGVLRRVLTALARSDPARGYCQSMNYVAAFALLVFKQDEEAAFWCCRTALEKLAPAGLYDPTLSGLHVELSVLGALLESRLPRTARKLRGLACPPSLFATEWMLCLFACSLPADTCLRVWDAWLNEGSKVLLRVSIALLARAEPQLLKANGMPEVVAALKTVCRQAHDRDALMDEAFTKVGSLPKAKLRAMREVASADLRKTSSINTARREEMKKNIPGYGFGMGF